MHVVFGANGRAGGEVAHALIERAELVRVVVRRPEHGKRWRLLGAEVVVASFEDAVALDVALQGARSAFLLCPPPVDGDIAKRATEISVALAQAAARAHLPKAVILSSVGAQHASGTGIVATLHQMESALSGVAPATAFLRSGYFVETWSEVAESAVAEGVLPTFLNVDQKIPMVSTVDVGRMAAQLLGEDWTGNRVVELGGPEDWSPADIAAAFAQVLGRPVAPVFVPPAQRLEILASSGVPDPVATALLDMYDSFASGRIHRQDGMELRRGTTALTTAIERIVTNTPATGQSEAMSG